jgi:hypothetical protein
MITKGYVIKKSTESSNKYSVRIPILESAGIGLNSNGLNSSVYDCTLSHNPGTYEALRPGDCVFISFEDNNYAKPIILGKLFVNVEEGSSGYQYNTDLKVTHKATLPVDTTIGSVPFDNILNYFNSINESIDRLSFQALSSLSANLILYPTNVSSDISGYFKMVTSIDDLSYNTTPVDIPTGVININNQLLASLVSEPGVIIGNPGVINITTIGNIKRTVGNNNQYAAFYFTISKRSISGTETLLTTSNETPDVIIPNIYEEFSATALLNNGEFLNTDRIVIKYYANLTGNTGSNYDFQFGGTNPVRTLFPVPVSSIPSPKASNIITDTTTFNGIISSADNTVQKALNTLDDHNHNSLYYTETESDARYLKLTGGTVGPVDITGNLRLTGTPTLTNQSRTIEFTGFDKEGEGDFSDAAFIKHTINTGGHTGSVLEISSQNDSTDGIAFTTNTSSQLKHNSNIIWDAGNDGSGSGLDADTLDGVQGTNYFRVDGTYPNNNMNVPVEGFWHIQSDGTGIPIPYYGHRWDYDHLNNGQWVAQFYSATSSDDSLWFRQIRNYATQPWQKLWSSTNDGSGSGLDADTLDGLQASGLSKLGSGSDFADGTLVVTSLDAAASEGPSWTIEVTGKGYGQTPFNFIAEGYNYGNTFINLAGYNYGSQNITYLKVLNHNGNLAFWWPRFGYWNSFDVKVTETSASGIRPNRVSSIINSTEPASAKKLQIDLIQNVNSSNISSYPLVIDKGGSQITTGSNWNNFNTPGMYGVASGSVFTGTGAPPSDIYTYGHLLVTAVAGQGLQQTYYPHTGNAVYFRTGWNGGGWYGWQKVFTSQSAPYATQTTKGVVRAYTSGSTLFIFLSD